MSPQLHRVSWKRVVLEVVVIVGSILVAFSLDAWWDSRLELGVEMASLSALADDFRRAAEELAHTKSGHRRVTQAGEQLLSYGEAGRVPALERARVDTLVSDHFNRRIFDPPTGTVQSVLGSGRIDLLTRDELVGELTQWSATVAELNTEELDHRRHFSERLLPYLSARLDIEDLDKGFAEFVDFPWDQEQTDAYELISDQQFLNIIYMHWVHSMNILIKVGLVEEALARIQGFIEAQLAD